MMRTLNLAETALVGGGASFTEAGMTVGAFTGGVLISPIAMIMGVFACDSPYSTQQNFNMAFYGIIAVGAGAGAALGGSVGALADGVVAIFSYTQQNTAHQG